MNHPNPAYAAALADLATARAAVRAASLRGAPLRTPLAAYEVVRAAFDVAFAAELDRMAAACANTTTTAGA